MNKTQRTHINIIMVLSVLLFNCERKPIVTIEEARTIAKEAYIYGNPLVDNYRILHAYFVDQNNPEFKAPFNQIKNIPKVYTPEDKAIQTPNSDTPYSMVCLDLRAEPVVVTLPSIEKGRYFSVQMVDGYTYNFHYMGSRTTGNEGGNYLFVGPDWKGEIPAGFKEVIHSETQFVLAIFRTQLFEPADLPNVINVQSGYQVQPLSTYMKQPAPAQKVSTEFLTPLNKEEQKSNLLFFKQLNFWLQFCATHESEKALMERFAKIGVGAGKEFDPEKFSPEIKEAIAEGMKDAWQELEALKINEIKTGKVTSGSLFGTREFLNNNYLYRFAGSDLGIYGNSKEEAMYPLYQADANSMPLDGATTRYTLTLKEDELPPVNSFWSFTMYEMPSSLLTANAINRYLINSPMLPKLKRNADKSITLYIQHESPGKDKEANWLPAPNGPFALVLRLYWPKPEAMNGTWKQPPLQPVQ
ncbi:MAG: DUF1254 domain-containing protein [Cyclobacteriaceae bacterium]|jgi:hypothetical protein|nr:DUF1254 domain-containing protein [Cyclobacteriaceae bacterium]